MYRLLIRTVLFFLLLPATADRLAAQSSYSDSLNTWYQKRIAALRAENGWLNLAGLFWLRPGINDFGSDSSHELVFAHPELPARAGSFRVEGQRVTWISAPGVKVTHEGKEVDSLLQYDNGAGAPRQLALGQFRWTIIRREDRLGVRFRNLRHPALMHFSGAERFDPDTSLRFRAKVISARRNLSFQNVLGQQVSNSSPGSVEFIYQGKSWKLDVLYEEPEGWLIVFGDATTGESTYTGGRFVYVQPPGADGFTDLDFNKAINPPCAFTPFATCPLPPPQNVLPFAIPAGEKNWKK